MVRAKMLREALKLVSGNRHAAARVLGVDRRYVLKMLKENPELDAEGSRAHSVSDPSEPEKA